MSSPASKSDSSFSTSNLTEEICIQFKLGQSNFRDESVIGLSEERIEIPQFDVIDNKRPQKMFKWLLLGSRGFKKTYKTC